MKTAIWANFYSVCLFASAYGPLPEPEYADTEVTTNVVFSLDREWYSAVRVKLECEASATNNLEILIGHDDNADGCLSIEETDLAFGYDCGVWFERLTEPLSLQSVTGTVFGVVSKELTLKCREIPTRWNLMRMTRRGRITDNESVTLSFDRKKFMIVFR